MERGTTEKKVTWVELFFDLVFVFAVTRTSELVQADHSWAGLARALVVFVPVYWVWVGMTMHANLHEIDVARQRLGVFAVAFCGLVLALALPEAWGERGMVFALAYWAARLVLLAMVHGLPHQETFIAFTVAGCLTGPMLVAGALLEGEARLAVWALAGLIDLSVPWLARRRLADSPFQTDHLTERYGTFVLIALGESVVATAQSAAEEPWTAAHLTALACSFAMVCGLWWVYFVFSSGAFRGALDAAPAAIEMIRPVLSYAHVFFVGAIIAIAAAIGRIQRDPREPLPLDTAALLCGGLAVFLLTFVFTRWRIYHDVTTQRLVAALCCVAWAAAAVHLPALASAGVLALVLVVLNLVENRIMRRVPRN